MSAVLIRSCAQSARVAALRVLSGSPADARGGLRRAELQLDALSKRLPPHARLMRLARTAVTLANEALEASELALFGREDPETVTKLAHKALRAADKAIQNSLSKEVIASPSVSRYNWPGIDRQPLE